MKKTCIPFCLACAGLLSTGCAPLLGLFSTKTDPLAATDAPRHTVITQSGSFDYTLDAGSTPQDVLFIFTASSAAGTNLAEPVVNGKVLPAPSPARLPSRIGNPVSMKDRIAEFNRDPYGALGQTRPDFTASRSLVGTTIAPPLLDEVDDHGLLKDIDINGFIVDKDATCHYVSAAPVSVDADATPRTLNIWVADNCWDEYAAADGKVFAVTQDMVDELAARFLKAGADDDIYDWVTNILGSEWGATGDASLIPFDGEITILLADIQEDDSYNGGIAGYFYSLNNFENDNLPFPYQGQSNERIMFVIDAAMFANHNNDGRDFITATPAFDADPDLIWDPDTDYWPLEMFSTLAHEFQHMIHYYQKGIVARGDGMGSDVWIEEMCSQVMEDLLADKMHCMGPRGVAYATYSDGPSGNYNGRIPMYNYFTYLPLEVSGDFLLENYSTAYAFGSFLARNSGGAAFLREVVHSGYTDSAAVTNAVTEATGDTFGFDALIQRWAFAVAGSDLTDMPEGIRYNSGAAFPSTSGGLTYRLGSMNFFNYVAMDDYGDIHGNGPKFYTPASIVDSDFEGSSVVYFLAAEALTDKKTFSVVLPEGVTMQVFLK